MNFKEELALVKAFIFDVDGVLARSELYVNDKGVFTRTTSTKDGYAIQFAIKQGFPLALITGGKSESIRERFRGLGVTDVYLDSQYKFEDYEDFLYKYSLDPRYVLYMGDDMPDYEVMQHVGVPTCPLDACAEIKQLSHYVSDKNGGEGCVRDVIEQVLRTQKKWGIDLHKGGYKQ